MARLWTWLRTHGLVLGLLGVIVIQQFLLKLTQARRSEIVQQLEATFNERERINAENRKQKSKIQAEMDKLQVEIDKLKIEINRAQEESNRMNREAQRGK